MVTGETEGPTELMEGRLFSTQRTEQVSALDMRRQRIYTRQPETENENTDPGKNTITLDTLAKKM